MTTTSDPAPVERLRDALAATGPPPDARELSEILWLACHLTPAAEDAAATPPAREPPPDAARDGEPAELPLPDTRPPGPRRPPRERTPVHPVPEGDTDLPGDTAAIDVLVPTAPMLNDPRGLQRALRPLKRRVPSRTRSRLDEEATAARIADTGLWVPVLVPERERWLGVDLVVDTGPSMRLWRPLAGELTEALVRQGAFSDVRVYYLRESGGVAVVPGGTPRAPRTLLDPSGRRAVLVLSDCSGRHWWNGRAGASLRHWAAAGPAAILQPLPERMWRRTAAPVSPGTAVLPRPGAPNTDLRFDPYHDEPGDGVPVPVLEISPRWFGDWAALLAGSGPRPVAMTTVTGRVRDAAPVRRERELPVGERVRRFLAVASPAACELAAHVAVSVPSLPVMRLIQQRVQDGAGPGPLAEVLLSGLLRPLGGSAERYEFVPGARQALLDTLPRSEGLHTLRTLEIVSAEIERRAGSAGSRFPAVIPLSHRSTAGRRAATLGWGPFALVNAEARRLILPPAPPPARPDTFQTVAVPGGSGPPVDPRGIAQPPQLVQVPQHTAQGIPGPPDPPGRMDLMDLLGSPTPESIARTWRESRPGRTATPIGTWENGNLLFLDPFDRHVWIIGEPPRRDLVRTILLGLAMTWSPRAVRFTFIENAPGGAYDDLSGLPHVDGPGGGQTPGEPYARAVARLREEAGTREDVLADMGVHDWDAYQALRTGSDQLPRRVVVVDDPHALDDAAAGGELLNLAIEGSMLGIHLVFSASGTPENARVPLASTLGRRIVVDTPPDTATLWSVPADPGTGGPGGLPPIIRFRPARPTLAESSRMVRMAAEIEHSPSWTARPLLGFGAQNERIDVPFDSTGRQGTAGVVIGDRAERQRLLRLIVTSQASEDVGVILVGLGDAALGEGPAPPNVLSARDELLGDTEGLRRLIGDLSDEIEDRQAPGRRSHRPQPLIVVIDVSLTLPTHRPELGELLIQMARHRTKLGVHLIVATTEIEDTTMWDRLLAYLDWSIAVSPIPPSTSRRLFGRARLSWPPSDASPHVHLRKGREAPVVVRLAESLPSPRELKRPVPMEPAGADLATFIDQAWRRAQPADAAPIGVDEDDDPVVLELREHGVITGARGRDELVRSVILSLALANPPDMLSFTLVDPLASDAFTGVWRLPHVAATVAGRLERERAHHHASMLASELDRRAEALETLPPDQDVPSPLMLVVFNDASPSVLDSWFSPVLERIVRDGPRLGVHLIRVVPEEDGASTSGGTWHLAPHGLGMATLSASGNPSVWFFPYRPPVGVDQIVRIMTRHGRESPPLGAGPVRPRRPLPDLLTPDRLPPVSGRWIPIGIEDGTHAPVMVDLDNDPHLLVVGPPGAGKTNLLRLIIKGIADRGDPEDTLICIIDPSGALSGLAVDLGAGFPADTGFEAPMSFGDDDDGPAADDADNEPEADLPPERRVHYAETAEDIHWLVAWLAEVRPLRIQPEHGETAAPEVYLIISDHQRLADGPTGLVMELVRRPGVHIVVSRVPAAGDEPLEPALRFLRLFGLTGMFMAHSHGPESRAWGVEPPGGGELPPGRAVLVQGGERKLIQIATLP
ncbi:SAV_2336 N-terminal domain-related protein [Actinomadura viridis]|uniref:SAV_2336 N-terminal domain-related protein n=1 Tax=Actinomadura viridis TaxID=58110 RepID=UPI0036AC80CA